MKQAIVHLLERLGGARPFSIASPKRAVALGLWWFLLFVLIWATIGRGTRFIYVDF